MTTVVTPTTMTAAYNSLSAAQKTEFKNALGISNSGNPEGGVAYVNTSITLPIGWDMTVVATQTMPRDGYITVNGSIAMVPVGTPNGTMGAWGVHLLKVVLNGKQVSTCAVPMAHATSQSWMSTGTTWLAVRAGDVINLYAGTANQGTMTNRYYTPVGNDYNPHAMSLSYHYIK